MSGLPTAHNEAGKGLGLKKTCSLRQLLYTALPELLCRERSGGPPQAAWLLTETYVHQDTQTQACSGALCIPQVQHTVSSPQVHTSVDLTTERGQAVHTEELSTLGMHMLQPLCLCSTFMHRNARQTLNPVCPGLSAHMHTLLRTSSGSVCTCCWHQGQQRSSSAAALGGHGARAKMGSRPRKCRQVGWERWKDKRRARCPGIKGPAILAGSGSHSICTLTLGVQHGGNRSSQEHRPFQYYSHFCKDALVASLQDNPCFS